jgi:hypothetical protein
VNKVDTKALVDGLRRKCSTDTADSKPARKRAPSDATWKPSSMHSASSAAAGKSRRGEHE